MMNNSKLLPIYHVIDGQQFFDVARVLNNEDYRQFMESHGHCFRIPTGTPMQLQDRYPNRLFLKKSQAYNLRNIYNQFQQLAVAAHPPSHETEPLSPRIAPRSARNHVESSPEPQESDSSFSDSSDISSSSSISQSTTLEIDDNNCFDDEETPTAAVLLVINHQ
jgi:hypothetical protein